MESVLQAIENIMTVESILAMIFGAVVGTVLGAIPGLNGTMAIALVLPITLYVSPWVGIPMILAIYKAATWGGSVGSIMINTPGTSAAIVVALDGYPLNRQGKPLRALKAALYSGIVGDILSDLVTIFICAPIATVALMIGPPEFMMLIVLALSIITILGDTAPVKAMISAGLGLFFACIGYDPVTQTPRLMFNVIELGDGIKFVPMLVGMFALSEALYKFLKENDKPSSEKAAEVMKSKENNFTWLDMWRNKFTALMGAGIGTFIGALPGIGSTVSPWLAYAVSKKTSKNPEEYGKGSVTGLISAQSACNAVSGANLIPLLTLGIPGDTVAAMLIGTMTIHGMQPGPLIMKTNPVGVYSIFVSLLVCDVIYFAVGVLAVKYAAAITKISSRTLTTLIVVMSVIGAYAYNRSMFDVFIMFVFGVLGYFMKVYQYSVASFMIAFILAPILEMNLRQSLILFNGNISDLFSRPVSVALIIVTVLLVAVPIIFKMIQRTRAKRID